MKNASQIESIYVNSGGVDYHVRSLGEGAPVLLLHGFPESSLSFRHNWTALANAGFRVLVPDLKGYGLTSKPRPGTAHGDYRMSSISMEIGGLIQKLGFERAHIVGHDWGGVILSAMMVRQRHRIDKAVLLNAPFRRFVPWKPRHIYWFNLPGWAERQFARAPSTFISSILNRWLGSGHRVEPEVLQEYVSGFCADGSFSCAMAYYRGLRKDLRFIVRALRLNEPEGGFPETLILWGAQDPILPTSVGVMAHKDITGSLFQALPMAGHFVHSEAPDEVNPRLIDFLSDCS